MKSVYLVGPIGGLSYEDATQWRVEAREVLEARHWDVFDPMTGHESLKGEKDIGVGLGNAKFVENGCIFHSDLFRINEADILLVNLLKLSPKQSVGTFFEYGYGYANKKMIITVTTDSYISKHPFIVGSSIVVSSMEQAYELINNLVR